MPMKQIAGIVEAIIPRDNVQHMERHAQNAVRLAISEWYAEAGEPEP